MNFTMRILSFLLFICLGLTTNAFAQGGVDITSAIADPKTFIFDDDKHTVHGYLYATLKEQTSCCGNDAVYLEVKFNEDGNVTSAKTLTGKNDCYKKSIVDIVKNVRWDATNVKGSKTIYFEVKPIIPCSGSPGENQYQAIAGVVNSGNSVVESSTSNNDVEEEIEEEVVAVVEEEIEEEVEEYVEEYVEEVEEEMEEEVEEVVAVVEEEVEEESSWNSTEDFLSDGGSDPVRESSEVSSTNNSRPSTTTTKTTTTTTTTNMLAGAQETEKYSGPVRIPPQAKLEYMSKGERSPTEDHRETFLNTTGDRISNPRYKDGENQLARMIRQELSKTGYCGLAQAAFELTIDPQGNVVDTRILAVNNEKIKDAIPSITNKVKFNQASVSSNYRSYHQFKAYFRCGEEEPNVDLEAVPNMIEPIADGN